MVTHSARPTIASTCGSVVRWSLYTNNIASLATPGNRSSFSGEPHLFCDCDLCQADWEDISLEDFIGSDSDPDDDFYYDDT